MLFKTLNSTNIMHISQCTHSKDSTKVYTMESVWNLNYWSNIHNVFYIYMTNIVGKCVDGNPTQILALWILILVYYTMYLCVCMYENFVIFIHYNTNIAHSHDKLLYVFENWSKSVRKICQRINEWKIISQLLFIIIIEYMLLNLTSLPLSSCYYAV